MKKMLIVASVVMLLMCAFALTVSAEACVHEDSWEVKFGSEGELGSWEAINVCPKCGYVIANDFCQPLVVSRGYSYYQDSFTQGFEINHAMVDKYEEYTGNTFTYGFIAGIPEGLKGLSPINADGTLADESVIASSFANSDIGFIDIKVVNIPTDSFDKKIVACLYSIMGDNVSYIDGSIVCDRVAGVTYTEVINNVDKGDIPAGTEEQQYRKLSAEEMEILLSHYWQSNHNTQYAVRRTVDNTPEKFASTRMFTRDELPSGSYVVLAEKWSMRPEVWELNTSGEIKKTSSRPGTVGSGTYTIEELWKDTNDKKSSYVYMAFNLSEVKSAHITDMTPETLAEILQIYVPYTTKVATNEYEATKEVSVEGLTLLDWTKDSLIIGKYWNSTTDPKPENICYDTTYALYEGNLARWLRYRA